MNTVIKISIIALLAGLISSCTSGTTASAGPLSITGEWIGAFLSSILVVGDDVINPTGVERISAQVSLNINQDEGGNLTGIASISDPETNCFTGGPIEGKITGSSYSMKIDDGFGSTITLTGQATASELNGVYNATEVADRCPPHTGDANFTK